MKRLLIIAAISTLCFILSFNGLTSGKAIMPNANAGIRDTLNKQSSLNRAHNLAIYKGIETGNLSAMDTIVNPDIVDHSGMEDIIGLVNVKKNLSDIHNHFTNLKMTLISDATSDDGMYHFALVRMTGTAKDATMGMPANTPFDRMSVDVVRLKNNKAAEHWSFADPKHMMKMMQMMDMKKH